MLQYEGAFEALSALPTRVLALPAFLRRFAHSALVRRTNAEFEGDDPVADGSAAARARHVQRERARFELKILSILVLDDPHRDFNARYAAAHTRLSAAKDAQSFASLVHAACAARNAAAPRPRPRDARLDADCSIVEHLSAGRMEAAKNELRGKPRATPQAGRPLSDPELAQLQALFPPAPAENTTATASPGSPLETALRKCRISLATMTSTDFKETLRNALSRNKDGAGAGPDGWTGKTLNYLASNCTDDLSRLAMRYVTSLTTTNSAEVVQALISGCLMPLQKPGPTPGWRPIVLIDIICRASLRALMTADSASIRAYFEKSNQYGLTNTQTPVIQVMSTLSRLHAMGISATAALLDCENAHNSVVQDAVLRALADMLEALPTTAPAVAAATRTICLAGAQRIPLRSMHRHTDDPPQAINSRNRGGGQGRPELNLVFNSVICSLTKRVTTRSVDALPDFVTWLRTPAQPESASIAPLPFETTLWRALAHLRPATLLPALPPREWILSLRNFRPKDLAICRSLSIVCGYVPPPATASRPGRFPALGSALGSADPSPKPQTTTPPDKARAPPDLEALLKMCSYSDDTSIAGYSPLSLLSTAICVEEAAKDGLRIRPDKSVFVTARASVPDLDALLEPFRNPVKTAEEREWKTITSHTLLGVTIGLPDPSIPADATTPLQRDLLKHIVSPLDKLTREATSTGAGDVCLFAARTWILPKLESFLAVWGLIAPPRTWTAVDKAFTDFIHAIIPKPCWTKNPSLREELFYPPVSAASASQQTWDGPLQPVRSRTGPPVLPPSHAAGPPKRTTPLWNCENATSQKRPPRRTSPERPPDRHPRRTRP